jgi:thiol-disulfide isomerase/thioredoxin
MSRLRALSLLWPAALLTAKVGASVAPAPTPGSAGDVLKAVREPGARVVLVNIWATWCIPCREEMPDLLRLRRAYAPRGLRVILVSGDFSSDREQAIAFLREQGVDFPTYIKTGSDMEFIDALDPSWSGALPATFIYDGEGRLRHALHGKASYEQFEEKVQAVLNAGR